LAKTETEKPVLFRRPASQKRGSLMASLFSSIFSECVELMRLMATLTGLSYKEINTIIFLILQPLLVLVFFLLWQREKTKGNQRKN
jgi:hypothetical protein